MTYEERNETASTFATRARAIAAALATETNRAWHYIEPRADADRVSYWFVLENDQRHAVSLNLDMTHGHGKIHASPLWPRGKDGHQPHLRTEEKIDWIGITLAKSDAQIARDIARRLLPGLERTFVLVAERIAEHDAYQGRAHADAQRLAKALGAEIRPDRNHNGDGKPQSSYTLYPRKVKGVHSVEVSGAGVSFSVNTSPEIALLLLSALPPSGE